MSPGCDAATSPAHATTAIHGEHPRTAVVHVMAATAPRTRCRNTVERIGIEPTSLTIGVQTAYWLAVSGAQDLYPLSYPRPTMGYGQFVTGLGA